MSNFSQKISGRIPVCGFYGKKFIKNAEILGMGLKKRKKDGILSRYRCRNASGTIGRRQETERQAGPVFQSRFAAFAAFRQRFCFVKPARVPRRKEAFAYAKTMDTKMKINMTFNYHTHTARCGHADGEEREYVERAIAAGIKTLGFSDHVPLRFPDGHQSGFRVPCERAEDYTETLLALKREYAKDIDIKIGYEMEYYPDFFEQMLAFIGQYPYDYLIMGQHFIENELSGKYAGSIGEDEEQLRQYVDQVLEGLGKGVYTYLAHPDVANYTGDEAIYEKHMRRLCEGAKVLHIPLEVNFLGILTGRYYPCDKFFRIAHDVGNEIVLGCDAHSPYMICEKTTIEKAEAFCERNGLVPVSDIVLRDPHIRLSGGCFPL